MHDASIFKLRIKDLLARIKEEHQGKQGKIVLFADFETDSVRFFQESTYYYFTGLQEPGVVLTVDTKGHTILYVPNYLHERSKWVASSLALDKECAKKIGVDEIKLAGKLCSGYQIYPFSGKEYYIHLIEDLIKDVASDEYLFVLNPDNDSEYIQQRLMLQRLHLFGCDQSTIDISPIVAAMRRVKDIKEIENLYKAIEITSLAQEAAAKAIAGGVSEGEVQASLEYIITGSQAGIAFPSIVATGKNGTVLHYMESNAVLQKGDLVVVDIGARYNGYCADITRTYPVSGAFTKRQKEVYTIVLQTQEYIASCAKPGIWLCSKERPEQSLYHLAKEFLKAKGYDTYFPHGIGHFLGLDVHDVGDYKHPLQVGDVITIEPGIYIPEEALGIRIEDNYWIVKDGAVCLSEGLPKSIEDIQDMVREKF